MHHPQSVAILNAGPLEWAFRDFANHMATVLWLGVTDTPPDRHFLLAWDGEAPPPGESFIPFDAIQIAGDKRRMAERFAAHAVPIPETHLLTEWSDVSALVAASESGAWALKYPTASGGSGHRLLVRDAPEPREWPTPFVVQRFIRMADPEVFRIYAVAGETIGFNVRRFPKGAPTSPWVAHARGARYEHAGEAPEAATRAARQALEACDLLDSFGCADLVRDGEEWLVLEVGTDGACGHVDRDLGDPATTTELERRLATAFWAWVGEAPPWGAGGWRRRV